MPILKAYVLTVVILIDGMPRFVISFCPEKSETFKKVNWHLILEQYNNITEISILWVIGSLNYPKIKKI